MKKQEAELRYHARKIGLKGKAIDEFVVDWWTQPHKEEVVKVLAVKEGLKAKVVDIIKKVGRPKKK
jgi:hypothetical protein